MLSCQSCGARKAQVSDTGIQRSWPYQDLKFVVREDCYRARILQNAIEGRQRGREALGVWGRHWDRHNVRKEAAPHRLYKLKA